MLSLCYLLPWLVLPAGLSSQDLGEPIRVEVEAVNVFVTVTDSKGRFVTDLTRDRFVVYEDGVPQTIKNFSHELDRPLRIALLLDTSSSVKLKLGFEQDAAVNFLRGVMRYNDQALVAEFDRGVTIVNDFTGSPAVLSDQIRQMRAGGGTALWDALYLLARDKMTARNARKTIILLSDGEDLHSKYSWEEAREMLQASEVTVYAIGTTRFGASSSKEGEENLKRIAEETGGTAFFPYSAERLEEAFDLINTELRSQYTLTYEPKNKQPDGRFRRIEVRIIDGKGLKVRHRRGYMIPDF
jgi:Ca-activated chloride channel family protein